VGDDLEALKERAWREVAAIDAALERGDIDETAWHRARAELIVPAYLAAPTPQGQSGHSGDEESWDYSRGVVADALDRDGAFLDVGCANGLLMESVKRWGEERGLLIEPFGLEIAPELAELARQRYPAWAARIFVGNAIDWRPPRRFAFVRTGVEYVPPHRRADLLTHLLDAVVAPGGRLIVGKFNEERDASPSLEQAVEALGFQIAGRSMRSHRAHPRLAYRAFWIDA
jgi:hypothetical protein